MSTAANASDAPAPSWTASEVLTGGSGSMGSNVMDPTIPAAGVALLWGLAAFALIAWRLARRGRSGWLGRPGRFIGAFTRSVPGRAPAPSVISTTALGAGHRLYVVQWRRREYLLGVSPGAAPSLIDGHPLGQCEEPAID